MLCCSGAHILDSMIAVVPGLFYCQTAFASTLAVDGAIFINA